MLDYAKRYLEIGFSVIPVGINKQPLFNWKEYQERRPTIEELETWFSDPDVGIAIITGSISGIAVLDLEYDSTLIVESETVLAKSGGGGKHYYFRYPVGQTVPSRNRILPKVDFKAEGGYVVAPPSPHKSGNKYEWVRRPIKTEYEDIPAWILESLGVTSENRWGDILHGVGSGNRNNTAAALIGKLLVTYKPDDWDTFAWDYVRHWNTTNDPPLDEKELRTVFVSLAKKELKKREAGPEGFDDTIEKEVVGLLLGEPKLMNEVYGRLAETDFYVSECREIYKAMRRFHEDRKDWNTVLIRAELEDPTKYAEYLFHDPISTPEQIDQLIQNIRKDSLRRTMYKFMQKESEALKDKEPGSIATRALGFFSEVDTTLRRSGRTSMPELIEKHQALMDLRFKGQTVGITTGFKDLDHSLGQGMGRRDLIVIGARPSVGKTSFALTVAYNASKAGSHVLFASLEMDDQEVMDRLIAFETGLPVTAIIRGKVKQELIAAGYGRLRERPLTIMYLPKATSGDIYSVASQQKHSKGLDLLVVDYLGMLSDDADNEVLRLGQISRGLRTTASLLDCAVLVPHQLSRKIENRSEEKKQTPLLSDLRDSGHIEQDADVVMFLNRDTLGNKSERTVLRIGKNRTGETAQIELRFNQLTTKFEQ